MQVKNTFFIQAAFAQGLPVYEMMDGSLRIPMRYPDVQIKGAVMTCWVAQHECTKGITGDKFKLITAMFTLAKIEIDKIKIALRSEKLKISN